MELQTDRDDRFQTRAASHKTLTEGAIFAPSKYVTSGIALSLKETLRT